MSRIVIVVLLAVSLTYGLPSNLFFNGLSEKIIGGSKAELGQFPYQAELSLNKHQCGGTILNNRWIVTAAHCVLGMNPIDFTIKLGTVTLNEGGDIYQFDKYITHKDYNKKTKQNDIALIRTSTEIQFSPNVQPLPLADSEIADDSEVVVSGWGYTTWPASTASNDLKFVHLNTIENAMCALRMIWFNTITTDQICTLSNRQGMCGGDSGGPLVHDGKLVGITSWGIPCADGYPDVFVKVYAYVDWINDNMK